MANFSLPYYKERLRLTVEDSRLAGVLTSRSEDYVAGKSQTELVRDALANPISATPLKELAKDKKHVVIISSDHTRPVPSRVTMPVLLEEIRSTNSNCRITILVATGMHRPTTKEELVDKYGADIAESEEIVVHNAYADEEMTFKGILPSGGELWINKLVDECDLLISEGFMSLTSLQAFPVVVNPCFPASPPKRPCFGTTTPCFWQTVAHARET